MRTRLTPLLLIVALLFTMVGTALAASKTFHENGNLQSETFYNATSKAKEKTNWYDQNGALQSEEKFVDAKTRVVTFFADKGQKKVEETFVDGKRVKVRTFYPAGGVEQEYGLKDEKLDGKFTVYFENGKIKQESEYKDGNEI